MTDTMTISEYRQSGKQQFEQRFAATFRQYAPHAPQPKTQFAFAKPHRGWKADFAWPDQKVILECDGGVYSGGRHVRGTGFEEDCRKCNYAISIGYRVFHVTPGLLADNPQHVVDQVLALVSGTQPPAPTRPIPKPKKAKKSPKAQVSICDNRELEVKFKGASQNYIIGQAAKVQSIEGVDHTPITDTGFAVVPRARVKLAGLAKRIKKVLED